MKLKNSWTSGHFVRLRFCETLCCMWFCLNSSQWSNSRFHNTVTHMFVWITDLNYKDGKCDFTNVNHERLYLFCVLLRSYEMCCLCHKTKLQWSLVYCSTLKWLLCEILIPIKITISTNVTCQIWFFFNEYFINSCIQMLKNNTSHVILAQLHIPQTIRCLKY